MTSRGIRNNTPGNIRLGQTVWKGLSSAVLQKDGEFCIFEDEVWGLRAILRIFHTYESRGLNTIAEWITKWAPPSDNNNTSAYIAKVCAAAGRGPHDRISIHNRDTALRVLEAIVFRENGQQPYSMSTLTNAFDLAFPQLAH